MRMGIMLPQAKEPPEAGREDWSRSFPQPSEGVSAADTLMLDFQPPEL